MAGRRSRGQRSGARAALALALSCAPALGCAGQGFYEHELVLAREGRAALASMADVEAAEVVTLARLERLEALARALPDEPRLHKMLLEGWGEYALLFVEDEVEEAVERGDEAGARYHALRARNAYARAAYHGDALFEGKGAAGAERGDASALLYWGASRLRRERPPLAGRGRPSDPAAIAEAVAAIERSTSLSASEGGGLGEALLGEWYADGPSRDAARSEAHFARARKAAAGRALLPELVYVRSALCGVREAERWDSALRAVLEAPDLAPDLRLQNAAAKRRAARDLGGTRRMRCLSAAR